MTAKLAALLSFSIAGAALAQVSTPVLTGTFSAVNNGPGSQTNPHVDCNTASYTNDDFEGNSTIHFWDFSTSTDHVVPGNGLDRLSDVSGNRIAFTELTASGDSVALYNTSSLTRIDLPGTRASNPALGGNLVAYEDRGYLLPPNQSEIDLYDLNADSVTRLTNDTLFDKNPAVSPSGNAVVWEKCQTDGLGCDIYSAIQTGPGVFTTHVLTAGGGEDRMPDTNGTVAVYVSDRSGENDIYYQPVAGGPETHLSIPGDQRDVAISGSLIAFDSNAGGTGYDIYVYDLAANTLYRVTNTPNVDETLTDLSVCNNIGRIVYAAPSNADFDVYAFTFTPPPPPSGPPTDCEPAADACANPHGRTLLANLTVTRGTGHPQVGTATFADPDPSALICVTNSGATSGAVSINDVRVVGPSAFKHSVSLIALRADGMQAVNDLEASIAGGEGHQLHGQGLQRQRHLLLPQPPVAGGGPRPAGDQGRTPHHRGPVHPAAVRRERAPGRGRHGLQLHVGGGPLRAGGAGAVAGGAPPAGARARAQRRPTDVALLLEGAPGARAGPPAGIAAGPWIARVEWIA
jgi:Tol biopolymer transport system component